jgi:probable HAF family extracellular repeat protein
MKRYLCGLVALGLLQGVAGQVKAQPTYSFRTFDVPGASRPPDCATASGINDSGQIVGAYEATSYTRGGFLFDNGIYSMLAVPGSLLPRHAKCSLSMKGWKLSMWI